ncbi:MAG: hypothetical protein JXB50_10910 [Spirochaetes bacterium]|nr:hypothetical protein [Spirochaetota bacterium]
MVKSSLFGLISFIILSNIVFLIKKFLRINEDKIMKIISDLLAKPLYKKQKEIINEILDISIMIDKICEINIDAESINLRKVKDYDQSNSQYYSSKVKYKNKNVGLLKITFKK